MSNKAPFTVVITDDNFVAVEVSDEFVELSAEEQLKVVEKFFWERNLTPHSTLDVSQDALKEEYTIIIAETIMSQLKSGIRFEKEGEINVSLENLENLGTILR